MIYFMIMPIFFVEVIKRDFINNSDILIFLLSRCLGTSRWIWNSKSDLCHIIRYRGKTFSEGIRSVVGEIGKFGHKVEGKKKFWELLSAIRHLAVSESSHCSRVEGYFNLAAWFKRANLIFQPPRQILFCYLLLSLILHAYTIVYF